MSSSCASPALPHLSFSLTSRICVRHTLCECSFQTEYGAWDLEDAGEGRLHHNGAISWSPVESVDGDLDEHGAGSSDVLGDFARHYEAEHGHELDLSYFESEEHDHEESDAGSESGDIFGLRRAFLYGYERGGEASDVEVEGSDYGEEHWNDDHPGWFGHLHEVIGPASWQDASSEDGAQNAGGLKRCVRFLALSLTPTTIICSRSGF